MPADPEIKLSDEFASTMQELVAQAAKTINPRTGAEFAASDAGGDVEGLSEKIANLERVVTTMAKKISSPAPFEGDVAGQLRRMEEQLAALCQTESVNQRLFNSLHQELKSYRDNFLRESLQKPFIRDLVMLFDDLSNLAGQMETSSASGTKKSSPIHQWSANLHNSVQALLEVLHRMDVTPIEAKERVDRKLHRVVSYEPTEFVEEDGLIVMRTKRGFVWRDEVLRPEEVVAKRFG
jgi:molecular chaperone GrpE (heat shock protein)